MAAFSRSLFSYAFACAFVACLPRLAGIAFFLLLEVALGALNIAYDNMPPAKVGAHFLETLQKMFWYLYMPALSWTVLNSALCAPLLFLTANGSLRTRALVVAIAPIMGTLPYWFEATAKPPWGLWFGAYEPLYAKEPWLAAALATAVAITFFVIHGLLSLRNRLRRRS